MASNTLGRSNVVNWIPLVFSIFFSICLMAMDVWTSWLNPARTVLSFSMIPVHKIAATPDALSGFFNDFLSEEPDVQVSYENLRKEYFQLKAEMLLMKSLQQENQTLRELLSASARVDEEITLSELMHVNIDPYQHRLMLNNGLSDKVYEGQAVIDDKGVVGQIIKAMPLSSAVMLITDPNHAIPVYIERNGLRMIAFGTGSISRLKIPFLKQNADIIVGDKLLASGMGGRFPAAYPVALITDVQVLSAQGFLQVTAKPFARIDKVNHVLLLSKKQQNIATQIKPEIQLTQTQVEAVRRDSVGSEEVDDEKIDSREVGSEKVGEKNNE